MLISNLKSTVRGNQGSVIHKLKLKYPNYTLYSSDEALKVCDQQVNNSHSHFSSLLSGFRSHDPTLFTPFSSLGVNFTNILRAAFAPVGLCQSYWHMA